MTDPNLPALREAVAKMTPGPWEYDTETHGVYNAEVGYGIVDAEPKDAAGIVALRNAAPALLDELEAARAENAALHQRPCPCCGATAEDYPATLETADHIAGLSNMVEDARERKGET
jgi:hypothetical protein